MIPDTAIRLQWCTLNGIAILVRYYPFCSFDSQVLKNLIEPFIFHCLNEKGVLIFYVSKPVIRVNRIGIKEDGNSSDINKSIIWRPELGVELFHYLSKNIIWMNTKHLPTQLLYYRRYALVRAHKWCVFEDKPILQTLCSIWTMFTTLGKLMVLGHKLVWIQTAWNTLVWLI